MPTPVSVTTTSTCESLCRSCTCTRPPCGVNFNAFDIRFQITCCSRSGSPEIGEGSGSRATSTCTPFASAAGMTPSTAFRTTSGRSIRWTLSRILPETIRETSSTSSTICVSEVAFRSITSTARPAFSALTIPERIIRE